MKTFSKICFILFAVSVPFLFYGFGVETLRAAATVSLRDPRWTSFLAGAAIFVPCYFLLRPLIHSIWSWIETFEHELTHLLIGLLFLKMPVGFRVSAHGGGEVKHVGWGTTGQTWVTLAPYFFPTVSIFVVVVAWFAGMSSNYLLGALGWATAFHLVSSWSETSFRQPDLKKAGILKTLLILPVMNLICYGAVIAFVAGGGERFSEFWINGIRHSWKLLTGIWIR
ncbi:MAG: hypothetical protein IPN69_17910 [Acidobacteria bacterium]|nr:hypothetical protein [Acidobacteriota bacterium]